jgi:hypothetical protein
MLIFTANARRGFTYDSANELLDLSDKVSEGKGSQATLARMFELLAGAKPVTTAMLRTAQPVSQAARTLADVTDAYWRRQRQAQAQAHSAAPAKQRQQPQPESAERSSPVTAIDERAVFAKWNSPKKAGNLGGVRPAPVTRGR